MKKGYFYTIAVLFFTGVLLAVFFSQTDVLNPVNAQQKRIAIMDDFLNDLHRDIDRAAYIAGFRSLLALEESVAENGTYLTDTATAFTEAFLNGTVNNVSYAVLSNATFSDYVQRVTYEAARVGMSLDLSLQNITLYHITPWEIAVDYSIQISLNDTRDATRWQYNKSFSTYISIYGPRDPLYSVATNNKLPSTVKIYNNFVEYVNDTGDKNDTTVLTAFLQNSYYSPNPSAPSFLMRFSGNFSANEFGIESLVDLDALNAQGLPVYGTRSVVDYLYFTVPGSADWCTVQNLPTYFKIDAVHVAFY